MDRASEDRSNSFGAQLRRARVTAGLAQEELAARAGLSPNTISGLERGEHRRPYPATIRALADALGLTDAERAALAAAMSAPAHHAAAPDAMPFGCRPRSCPWSAASARWRQFRRYSGRAMSGS